MKIGNIILWWLMHQTSHWQSCESERSCAPREGSHSSHSQNASSGSVEIKRCCVLVEETARYYTASQTGDGRDDGLGRESESADNI
jgi:hypothetical protein